MSAALDSLPTSIAHLRTIATPAADYRVMPFGVDALDSQLGAGGLRTGALHEATSRSPALVDDAATTLFLAGIAAREAAGAGGPVLWASCRADLYAPALEQAGLPSANVIYAQPRDDAALLAVVEDAVRDGTPAAIVAEASKVSMVATRRLQLVAADADVPVLLLRRARGLHGGEERFCRRLIAFCKRAGFTARVAVADTPGAAHALARYGRGDLIRAEPGATASALAPLPIVALRLAPSALSAARRFGFETVADLLPVARGPLARRLGLPAITRLDQALGAVAEPITPREDAEVPLVERRLLEPIGTAEAIEQVMGDLLRDLAGVLQERGLGARALRLTGLRVDGTEQVVAVGTSRPTREVPHLLRLLKLKIERIDPGMGLEQFWLVAPYTEPLDAVDLGAVLAGETLVRDPARLVDVIAGRIGPRAVFRVAPVESHVPERAVARSDPNETPGPWPKWPRPIRLFARPEPLARVMALMPDQPPRRFEWRGKTYKIVAGDGPERVHGEWWRRDAEVWAVRDYYRVEDQEGGRYWVFRRGDGFEEDTGDLSWWMHGVFG
ncbi:MAG TPA: DNA polymerase Y family protein [Sphingomonas sanguinis]|uniref:DNA polymerase Y family protein n=1 Tax=Sphingomonas sanguinis TaxID=33051 RepID=UPI002AC25654|nr:DNA polymerase Y family protein [Sphingomonas sanguinis]